MRKTIQTRGLTITGLIVVAVCTVLVVYIIYHWVYLSPKIRTATETTKPATAEVTTKAQKEEKEQITAPVQPKQPEQPAATKTEQLSPEQKPVTAQAQEQQPEQETHKHEAQPATDQEVKNQKEDAQPSEQEQVKTLTTPWFPLKTEEEEQLAKIKEKLVVKTVDTEPVLPQEEEAKRMGFFPMHGGGYLHESKDAKGNVIKRVVVPAVVLVNSGYIEVVCCVGAKEYESILKPLCDIRVLDLALIMSGFRKGYLPKKFGEADESDPARTLVFAQFKNQEGQAVTYRLEDLIIDMKTGAPMPRFGWTYLGEFMETDDPVRKRREKVLKASLSLLILTSMRDTSSLLDNPMKDEFAIDDRYSANHFLLPKSGSNILLIFRRPTEDELKEIKNLEKEFYAAQK